MIIPAETTAETPYDVAIAGLALGHGITLDQPRLQQLVNQAAYLQRCRQSGVVARFSDIVNNLSVKPAEYSSYLQGTVAEMDFTPDASGNEDIVSGNTLATPEHMTQFTLMGIQALQNYVLLVEAGAVEKPAYVHGATNPTMAILAERVGMLSDVVRQNPDDVAKAHAEMRKQSSHYIYAKFDELSSHVFSSETYRFERLLSLRLRAQQSAGELAVSKTV